MPTARTAVVETVPSRPVRWSDDTSLLPIRVDYGELDSKSEVMRSLIDRHQEVDAELEEMNDH